MHRRKTDMYSTWNYQLLRLQLHARALHNQVAIKTSRWQKKSLWRRHMGESACDAASDEESDEEISFTPQQIALQEVHPDVHKVFFPYN